MTSNWRHCIDMTSDWSHTIVYVRLYCIVFVHCCRAWLCDGYGLSIKCSIWLVTLRTGFQRFFLPAIWNFRSYPWLVYLSNYILLLLEHNFILSIWYIFLYLFSAVFSHCLIFTWNQGIIRPCALAKLCQRDWSWIHILGALEMWRLVTSWWWFHVFRVFAQL